MPNAVLETSTGVSSVRRWGEADFTPTLAGDEIQVALNPDASKSDPDAPNRHYTVVAGDFSLLSPADQATADAAFDATLRRAQSIAKVFQNAAQLPLPPPIEGVFVAIVNGPGGLPGLALSTPTFWVLFAADGQQGP